MAATPSVDLDPFTVAVALAGAFFGPKLSYYIGAYGLILAGWFAGVLFGLYRRGPDAKLPIWAFVMATMVGSLGITVPAAELASHYLPFGLTALLFPVAFVVPAFPDKWGGFAVQLLEQWRARRNPQ